MSNGCDQTVVKNLQAALKTATTAVNTASTLAKSLVTPIGGTPVDVLTTPAALDAALAKAVGGETFVLDPTLVYPSALTLTKAVTLRSSLPVSGRATLTTPMPSFKDGLSMSGPVPMALYGLEVRKKDPLTSILVFGLPGAGDKGRIVDGCRVLGDVINGGKRGMEANAAAVQVLRNYVEDCFGYFPGSDTQAFCAWDSPGPFLMQDNYFSGGSETFLLGGADPTAQANIPSHGVVTGNTFTKRPQWQAMSVGVKNTVELKNAIDWDFENNDISQSWGQHGQDGFLLMLTPRNQDGGAPYSTLSKITIRGNRFSHAACWVAVNGDDDLHPSGRVDGLVLDVNTVTDLAPGKYRGAEPSVSGTQDKVIMIGRGPTNVSITGNTVAGQNFGADGSAVYLSDAPKCVNLVLTGNTLPPSRYGLMGGGGAPDLTLNDATKAWAMYVASGSLGGNRVA